MNDMGIALAIASGICWAALDSMRKYLLRGLSPLVIVILLNWGQLPLLLAWWWWQGGDWEITPEYWMPGLIALSSSFGANLLFLWAIRISDLSRVVPVLSLTPALGAASAWLLLDEVLSPRQMAGIAAVMASTVLLAYKRRPGGVALDWGVVIMATVAALWSVTATFDKVSLLYLAAPTHALVQISLGSALLCLALVQGDVRQGLRKALVWRPWLALSAGTTLALAFLLQLGALLWLYVGVFDGYKRGVGIVAAVVVGRWLFGESVNLMKLLAVVLSLMGVYALSGV